MAQSRSAGGHIRPYLQELSGLWRLCDLLWIAGCFRLSLVLHDKGVEEKHILLGAVSMLLFYYVAELLQLYRSWRAEPLQSELLVVAWSWLAVVVSAFALGYGFKVTQEYSRLVIGTWFVLVPIALTAWRALIRGFLHSIRRRGRNTRTAVIVGTSELGQHVAQGILKAPWMGVQLSGFYDDRSKASDRIPDDLPAPLAGTCTDLLEAAKAGDFDIVYITLPVSDAERISGLVEQLNDSTASVYVVPDMFLFEVFQGRWVRVGDVPAVSIYETPFYGVAGSLKRIEDVVLASATLFVMALPMLCIAAAVKLSSPGPVIFKQRRYGLDGKEFQIWKFRSMTLGSDAAFPEQARRDDPRVTRVGAFLRRTSLDELPQFFNVLQGTMAIVGPRPHASGHNEHYRRLIRAYMVRQKVRPGITGWAQVNGWRGETETVEKMASRIDYDLWYIRNWTLMLDLRIVAQTMLVAWRGTAY